MERAERNRRYYQEHKEEINAKRRIQRRNDEEYKRKTREYKRGYYQTHKKQQNEATKRWAKNNPEKVIEGRRRYYQEHKEEIYEKQKKYNEKNRKKITKMVCDYRKRKGKELKEQGQMYCYLSKTARENKMVAHLCKKIGVSEEKSRAMLEKRNWNIKGILNDILNKSGKSGKNIQ